MASFDETLCICHINARSILAFNEDSGDNQFKMDEIRQILVDQMKYSLIAVSETWLTANTSIDDNDFKNLIIIHSIERADQMEIEGAE